LENCWHIQQMLMLLNTSAVEHCHYSTVFPHTAEWHSDQPLTSEFSQVLVFSCINGILYEEWVTG